MQYFGKLKKKKETGVKALNDYDKHLTCFQQMAI